ncbi:MAG TPA: SDR family oxidoreductase [Rhabdochlamydiaceae bacterium]|nr:SDR family oxidoreductase [Rhabdochlamydiaceae bacterium]
MKTVLKYLCGLFTVPYTLLFPATSYPQTKKVVLITGASRGIGKETAIHLAEQGHIVYATMRQPDTSQIVAEKGEKFLERLFLKKLDVTNEDNCRQVVEEILQKEGCIDVLLNNAAEAVFGCAEMVTIDQAKRVFDVNLFGCLRMIQAVLPAMRKQNKGLILNMSSVGGFRPSGPFDLYVSSKFALEGLSENLAISLSRWNINVVLIEPGPVATEFCETSTGFGSRFEKEQNPYSLFVYNFSEWIKKKLKEGQSPKEIAFLIEEIINTEKPHFRYQTSDRIKKDAEDRFRDPTGDLLIKEKQKSYETFWRSNGID